jgi:two-component system CheB/CheR fusion protein
VLAKICAIVRRAEGVDFSEYKAATFERRLARRMALRQVTNYAAYLRLLESEADEVTQLYEDALIHVTSFFRDPEAFDALKKEVFPAILAAKKPGAAWRIWVAGCSTGEEIYSIAIALLEFLRETVAEPEDGHRIQLFGSDASRLAIERARQGVYAESALRDVSDERRRKYFVKIDSGYRIHKAVRDLCVFVHHDLARDPPFSKVDLVSCRNVLIYFDQPLQKRIFGMLHYCLVHPGFLLLGQSESVGSFTQLFSPVDKAHKIFARTAGASALQFASRVDLEPARRVAMNARGSTSEATRPADAGRHLDRLLLSRYAPPGVLVNDKFEVLQFRGDTSDYLQHAPGAPSSNLANMARGGLMPSLRKALSQAQKTRAPVRVSGVEVDSGDRRKMCDVVVMPFTGLPDAVEPLFVVMFESTSRARKTPEKTTKTPKRVGRLDTERVPRLEHELGATKDYLQAMIEEHGRATDELGSANEELVSGNEELQSMNEELETAKEELQSTNEELTTVNDELRSRNLEVSRINGDLLNLIDTVDIPILILDMDQRIRRFTPKALEVLNVVPADVGRRLSDIRPNVDVPDLERQITEVLRTITPRESEVKDREGRWYRMRIRPYRTPDDRIDGVVISLVDIDALKQHVGEAHEARVDAERANRTKDQFLATLSHELRTPLATMLMHAQLLRRGDLDAAKLQRTGAAIERGTRMQVQLIDDLLDVSRIASGKLHMSVEPTDLAAVVATAIEGAAAQAKEKLIALLVDVDTAVRPVSGDPMRLQQVVSNLLTNAIKFTPKNGHVTVSVDMFDGAARLRVTDTGMGIAPAFLPHVFARFSQDDASNARAHGGLGLGLAIVRHIVELHGGSIVAESPGPKLGATFTIMFPLLQEGIQPAPRVRPKLMRVPGDGGMLHDLRVLVVDDDAIARDAVVAALESAGAEVRTAESAAHAMVTVVEFRPDVLVSDIAMPGEDGYSLIKRIRGLGIAMGGDVPALALTALAGVEDHRKALASGFQMHLGKPIDIDHLTDAVVELAEWSTTQPPLSERAGRPSKTT